MGLQVCTSTLSFLVLSLSFQLLAVLSSPSEHLFSISLISIHSFLSHSLFLVFVTLFSLPWVSFAILLNYADKNLDFWLSAFLLSYVR